MKLLNLYEIEEEYISLDTAKLAKGKNVLIFGLTTWYWKGEIYRSYDDEGNEFCKKHVEHYLKDETQYLCPTQSLLQRYLREKYSIMILVSYNIAGWFWGIKTFNGVTINLPDTPKYFNTYEEALEDGLKQGLKLIEV